MKRVREYISRSAWEILRQMLEELKQREPKNDLS